jgi:hypothetical protein
MDDKRLGTSIVIFTLIIMVAYFVWAFSPFIGFSRWIPPSVSIWAYRLPVVLAVYFMLGIIIWIGWTMASTPPPLPIENPLDFEKDKEENSLEEKIG